MRKRLLLAALLLASPAFAGESARDRRDFHASWKYYRWRIERGDSLADLEDVLVRIQERYARDPVNHWLVEREMIAAQVLRSLDGARAVGGE